VVHWKGVFGDSDRSPTVITSRHKISVRSLFRSFYMVGVKTGVRVMSMISVRLIPVSVLRRQNTDGDETV